MPTETATTEPPSTITAQHMENWNRMIADLREKGIAGDPRLDHDEKLRKKVFEDYNKAHPTEAVDYNMVGAHQAELQKYKQSALSAIQSGKGELDNTTPSKFMNKISKTDAVFGKLTSNQMYPEAYILNKATGEKKSIGFAPKVNLLAALNK